MIVKFNNPYLEKLFDDKPIKKFIYSKEIIVQFKKTVLRLKQVENSQQLKQFRGLNFEALKGDKKGLYSVRVNQQYRLEFTLENDSITLVEVVLIEDLSKHYE
jgi:proteic killer suppression protein